MSEVDQGVRFAVGSIVLQMLSSSADGQPLRFGDWYAGITNDPKIRLYGEPEAGHNVPSSHSFVITHECPSHNVADQAEGALHRCGCEGQTGLGQNDSVILYAYKRIPSVTNP